MLLKVLICKYSTFLKFTFALKGNINFSKLPVQKKNHINNENKREMSKRAFIYSELIYITVIN